MKKKLVAATVFYSFLHTPYATIRQLSYVPSSSLLSLIINECAPLTNLLEIIALNNKYPPARRPDHCTRRATPTMVVHSGFSSSKCMCVYVYACYACSMM